MHATNNQTSVAAQLYAASACAARLARDQEDRDRVARHQAKKRAEAQVKAWATRRAARGEVAGGFPARILAVLPTTKDAAMSAAEVRALIGDAAHNAVGTELSRLYRHEAIERVGEKRYRYYKEPK